MLNDSELQLRLEACETMGLDCFWLWAEKEGNTFEARREAFLWILRRLLDSGRVKLHKDGKILEGTTDEWVQCFRQSFPLTPIEADKVVYLPGDPSIGTGRGMNLWWFMEDCPGQAVWIDQDTGQASLTW